ncbi:MAG: shikimate dehydrogenase [Planctomycetaceae bacterium]|nr:shikimate dehydrogenase [Planctomycetaceae bacterium]
MICVSLGRTRHSAFLEGHKLLAEKKAELVELRVDWMRKRPDIGRLLTDRPTPVVVTCRRREDKGLWKGTEEQRQTLLREAIIAGAEYVDIEEDIAPSIPRYGDTKRIVSYHNFDETPDDLEKIYGRMTKCDPDIIKIVTMANSPLDNVRLLQLAKNADVPTVAFCMGEMGLPSRVLCARTGAPFTYAGFSREREMAPGQLTYEEMRYLYRFDRITEKTKVFGVLGDPIAHSLSPLLHNTAFRKQKFDGVYLPLRVPADVFEATLKAFDDLGIDGYSVTIPHKQAAIEFADQPDIQADLIGASNTLFRKEGAWQATNTDYDAIIETLTAAISDERTSGPVLKDKRVLILGAGGVARAAACAMQQQGASVVVSNRTKARAKELAEEIGCLTVPWENRGAEKLDVLINCTSVGMQPNVNESPYEQHWLHESMVVFDTVYTPENTLLMKHAKERGCRTASGIEMFVRQAARQFELFTDSEAPREYMTETLRRYLSAAR